MDQTHRFVHHTLIVVGVTTAVVVTSLPLWAAINVFLLIFAGVLLAVFLRGLNAWVQAYTSWSAGWALIVVAAMLVAFQYFTIVPMRHLSPGEGLHAALKADSLSLTAWQVDMYGWMAFVTFGIFGHELPKTQPVFWFMMQLAMLAGFLTSYPVNWWLVRAGIKEKM